MQAFQALGSSLEEHVTIKRVEPAAYRVWFGDGTHLDLLNDHDAMAEQLEGVEPGAGAHRRECRLCGQSTCAGWFGGGIRLALLEGHDAMAKQV